MAITRTYGGPLAYAAGSAYGAAQASQQAVQDQLRIAQLGEQQRQFNVQMQQRNQEAMLDFAGRRMSGMYDLYSRALDWGMREKMAERGHEMDLERMRETVAEESKAKADMIRFADARDRKMKKREMKASIDALDEALAAGKIKDADHAAGVASITSGLPPSFFDKEPDHPWGEGRGPGDTWVVPAPPEVPEHPGPDASEAEIADWMEKSKSLDEWKRMGGRPGTIATRDDKGNVKEIGIANDELYAKHAGGRFDEHGVLLDYPSLNGATRITTLAGQERLQAQKMAAEAEAARQKKIEDRARELMRPDEEGNTLSPAEAMRKAMKEQQELEAAMSGDYKPTAERAALMQRMNDLGVAALSAQNPEPFLQKQAEIQEQLRRMGNDPFAAPPPSGNLTPQEQAKLDDLQARAGRGELRGQYEEDQRRELIRKQRGEPSVVPGEVPPAVASTVQTPEQARDLGMMYPRAPSPFPPGPMSNAFMDGQDAAAQPDRPMSASDMDLAKQHARKFSEAGLGQINDLDASAKSFAVERQKVRAAVEAGKTDTEILDDLVTHEFDRPFYGQLIAQERAASGKQNVVRGTPAPLSKSPPPPPPPQTVEGDIAAVDQQIANIQAKMQAEAASGNPSLIAMRPAREAHLARLQERRNALVAEQRTGIVPPAGVASNLQDAAEILKRRGRPRAAEILDEMRGIREQFPSGIVPDDAGERLIVLERQLASEVEELQ